MSASYTQFVTHFPNLINHREQLLILLMLSEQADILVTPAVYEQKSIYKR